MTGILLTIDSFKRFAKKLQKIKTELTLTQSQEELSQIFGFKNFFHLKQMIVKSNFYITIENFEYFSSRLKINIESSKFNDCFANIIGYKDYNTFYLTMCSNTFIKDLSDNLTNIKKFYKCVFLNVNEQFKFVITINDVREEQIMITIKIGTDITFVQDHEIMNVTNYTEKKEFLTLDIDVQKRIISSLSVFKNKNNDFVNSIIPILKKRLFTNGNITKSFRLFLLKRKGIECIGNNYYEAYYYIIPYNRLDKKVSMLLPFNDEYIKSDCLAPFGSQFIYQSLEDAHLLIDKASKIMKMNTNALCIAEIYNPLFCDKTEKLSCKYFTIHENEILEEHSFKKFLLDKKQ